MYDIKSIEFGQQQQDTENSDSNNCNNNNNNSCSNKTIATATKVTNIPNSFAFFDHHYPLKTPSTIAKTIGTPSSCCGGATKITCSIISSSDASSLTSLESSISSCTSLTSTASSSTSAFPQMTLMSLRRRRILQRQACLLSIVAAFIFGLALGVFMPMVGLTNVFSATSSSELLAVAPDESLKMPTASNRSHLALVQYGSSNGLSHPPSDFPTIYELHNSNKKAEIDHVVPPFEENLFSVSFIKEKVLPAEEVFQNAFHLEQDKTAEGSMIVKKLDASDGSIKEFRVQRTSDGRFRKGPERRLSKPSVTAQVLNDPNISDKFPVNFIPIAQQIVQNARNSQNHGIIKSDIYWGDLVEQALPKGFTGRDAEEWNNYIRTAAVVKNLQTGCGRMQNRLVIFADGTRACARYRQNTDQIQGELFSFYLGQILNLTNLAPSAASVIDLDSETWSSAIQDITNAQWKSARPVVLTRWLSDLEPAGIPTPFQPLERHLNKYDVWNITLGAAAKTATKTKTAVSSGGGKSSNTIASLPSASSSSSNENHKGLLKRLGAATKTDRTHQSPPPSLNRPTTLVNAAGATFAASASVMPVLPTPLNSTVLQRLIELAQWSDLIVFDYLIANLDRVVNNLYNYQWNADIMAAPAHNLARQTNSQLLVFLDNESGLLHGYRLLKKYEAYHGLLLDNLCVFRQPTIEALHQLREYGPGRRLHDIFERTTSQQIRDVLPSLPDKSIKILIDRIDRVLGQVQKCRDLFSDR